MARKVLNGLQRRMDEHSKNLNEVIKYIRKYQMEIINELENTRDEFNSRMDKTEACISELEDKAMGQHLDRATIRKKELKEVAIH